MIKKIGKKGRAWQRARRAKAKELEATGEFKIVGTVIWGPCTDCKRESACDLDHVKGRGVKNANDPSNLEPVCRECHSNRHLERQGKIMSKEKKESTKNDKPKWAKEHACKNCKNIVSTLLCTQCGKMSV